MYTFFPATTTVTIIITTNNNSKAVFVRANHGIQNDLSGLKQVPVVYELPTLNVQ